MIFVFGQDFGKHAVNTEFVCDGLGNGSAVPVNMATSIPSSCKR